MPVKGMMLKKTTQTYYRCDCWLFPWSVTFVRHAVKSLRFTGFQVYITRLVTASLGSMISGTTTTSKYFSICDPLQIYLIE